MTIKFSFLPSFLLIGVCAVAQPNPGNQAVVTIVGDAPDVVNNEPHDFIQSNPYNENKEPQMQQMTQGNIEPTLENGFHLRYELQTGRQEEPMLLAGINTARTTSSGGSLSGGGASVGKSRKHGPSMDQRKFNVKKRLKAWLPQRKKRYRPHMCGRF